MKLRLNIDRIGYKYKPSKFAGAIRKRMAETGIVEVTPDQLMSAIEAGRSFYPGALTSTDGKSWTSQQLIAVDVDNKVSDENGRAKMLDEPLTPDEALVILDSLGIKPYFMYWSFSRTEEWPKFRICIILDEALTDPNDAPMLTDRLIAQLNEVVPGCADEVTSDNARLFFGGRPGCVFYKGGHVTPVAVLRALPETEDETQQAPEDSTPTPRAEALGNPDAVDVPAPVAGTRLDDLKRQLTADIKSFDLVNYILRTESVIHTERAGKDLVMDPCPICTSPDGLKVKGGQWHCHSDRHAGTIDRGSIIDWLMARHGWDKPQAFEHFKFEIMRYDRDEWTRAWKETRNVNPAQDFAQADAPATLEPADYTDVGQADVFFNAYGDRVRYCTQLGYLVYNGVAWKDTPTLAQGKAKELTRRQMREAAQRVHAAREALAQAVTSGIPETIREAKAQLSSAEGYLKYVKRRQSAGAITATLAMAQDQIYIDPLDLDKNVYLLNTPAGTIDLRTGKMHAHSPTDFCTKMTGVAPSEENADAYTRFIERITGGDADLARYLQEVAGMCAFGSVKIETLIIAYGPGGNGKSTLFNLWADVLGDYSGKISADLLTTGYKGNKKFEYIDLFGKRLVIAAETEEGERLSTGTLKALFSTDEIKGEKKFKDSIVFKPSHTLILYTNFLPKVGSNDLGTWDRLTVVPFKCRIRGANDEVKDYANELFRTCGGAVLTWIIEGARRFIENGFKIVQPACVREAIEEYRQENDWMTNFLDECCEVGPYRQPAGALYAEYCFFCDRTGDYKRNKQDFNRALRARGYQQHKDNESMKWHGLRISPEPAKY